MSTRIWFAAALAATAASFASRPAEAQPGPGAGAAMKLKAKWNSSGWVLLGERRVDGRADHDAIHVGKQQGPFTNLMVVVEDGDLEMRDMAITFGDGSTATPEVRQVFHEDTRTRSIDLPGEQRLIKAVNFHYGNIPGGQKARVELWGKLGAAANPGGGGPGGPPTAPPPGAGWNHEGWTMLGETAVNGKRDRDIIRFAGGVAAGPFTHLMLVVEGAPMEMRGVTITFGNGQPFSPEIRQVFNENTRTRAIDLPGEQRDIRQLDFRYGNIPGGGQAHVQVWAKVGNGGVVPPGMGGGMPPGGMMGGRPIVTDYWPRQGPAGTMVQIEGRRFTPAVQVVYGGMPIPAMQTTPTSIIVKIPKAAGDNYIVLHRPAGRDVLVGGFNVVAGPAPDRHKIWVTWHSEADKWWRMRQAQLAKNEAEREAALEAQEQQLERERDKRRQEFLTALRAQWEQAFLEREEVKAELGLHSERMARLDRMLRLAEVSENAGLAVRVRFLIDFENDRHDQRMKDLKAAAARG
jgi:IPT/TIG domain